MRNILPHLARQEGLELHLLLHADQGETIGELPPGIHLHAVTFTNGFGRRLLWEQMALPGMARRLGIDVTFSLANYGPLLAPRPVIMLRNALGVFGQEYRLSKWLYWAGLTAATLASLVGCRAAIAVSDYARRAMGFGIPALFKSKIAVIHHGVDRRFTPTDQPTERTEGALLAVSDIYVQKNFHTLIRAVARVRQTHPTLRLDIAGRLVDMEYHQELSRLAGDCGVSDCVRFLGSRTPDELVALYRGCDAFVFPSTVETFGNPLVEAMACGTPVICSNSAAMPEVAGDAALLIDPLDEAALAAAISRVLDEPELRADLIRRSLARAADFSWEKTGALTAAILRRAAGR
ncbi:Glycosyltransferase [Paramagnetospirillum magneticum AMB-1]|uniref:Glycosyltransferase n=1 Tax=Paramagnetospirillum magneticum (strain ATCC 700264 / AMB-1) TaxID=342108 RepID=Q2WB70_PARM1|nr:Glycosyltransferase [Paramagnetospirillum magneticum AMB-1]